MRYYINEYADGTFEAFYSVGENGAGMGHWERRKTYKEAQRDIDDDKAKYAMESLKNKVIKTWRNV